jgi:hypothetical protein
VAHTPRSRYPRRRVSPSPTADTRLGIGNADEPPIMWPPAGSGFEADPFSPSGMAQQEWVLASHLGRRRGGKVVIWIVLVVLMVSLLSPLFNMLR